MHTPDFFFDENEYDEYDEQEHDLLCDCEACIEERAAHTIDVWNTIQEFSGNEDLMPSSALEHLLADDWF